jgi:actin-like ATPase involved in cell morphogenesis
MTGMVGRISLSEREIDLSIKFSVSEHISFRLGAHVKKRDKKLQFNVSGQQQYIAGSSAEHVTDDAIISRAVTDLILEILTYH